MSRLLIPCVLAACFAAACSSKPPVQTRQQPTTPAAVTAFFVQVQDPTRELCTDDTLSSTEWVNVPLVRFSGSAISLNGRSTSEQQLSSWAETYYQPKVERALWVEVSPDGMENADRALLPLLRRFPDLHLRQVAFGFACPKVGK